MQVGLTIDFGVSVKVLQFEGTVVRLVTVTYVSRSLLKSQRLHTDKING